MVLNQIHKKLAPIIFVIDTSAGMAEESIDSGKAYRVLEKLIEASNA